MQFYIDLDSNKRYFIKDFLKNEGQKTEVRYEYELENQIIIREHNVAILSSLQRYFKFFLGFLWVILSVLISYFIYFELLIKLSYIRQISPFIMGFFGIIGFYLVIPVSVITLILYCSILIVYRKNNIKRFNPFLSFFEAEYHLIECSDIFKKYSKNNVLKGSSLKKYMLFEDRTLVYYQKIKKTSQLLLFVSAIPFSWMFIYSLFGRMSYLVLAILMVIVIVIYFISVLLIRNRISKLKIQKTLN